MVSILAPKEVTSLPLGSLLVWWEDKLDSMGVLARSVLGWVRDPTLLRLPDSQLDSIQRGGKDTVPNGAMSHGGVVLIRV